MDNDYIIKELELSEISEAMSLVLEVFNEFEAPEYPAEGVKFFRESAEVSKIIDKVLNKNFRMWGCFISNRLVGVLAKRPPCHISLLFVDKNIIDKVSRGLC